MYNIWEDKIKEICPELKVHVKLPKFSFLAKAFAAPFKGKILTVENFFLLVERNLLQWLSSLVYSLGALVLQLGNPNLRFECFGWAKGWCSVGCCHWMQKPKPLCLSFWEELHVSCALGFLPGYTEAILFSTATCSNAINSEIILVCLFITSSLDASISVVLLLLGR